MASKPDGSGTKGRGIMGWMMNVMAVEEEHNVYGATGIHLNVMMYALCFWLTTPLMPYIAKDMEVNETHFAYLQTAMEVAQIISSLYFGQVIDKWGVRIAMVLAQAGSMLVYFLVATSFNYGMLMVSRIPTIFMAVMLCAQGGLTTLASPDRRAAALGRISVSYMLGMVAGSVASGELTKLFGYRGVNFAAAGISCVMAFSTMVTLPPIRPAMFRDQLEYEKEKAKQGTKLDPVAVIRLARRPTILPIVLALLVSNLGISIYRSQLGIMMAEHLDIPATDAGFVSTVGAAVGVLTNGFLVGKLRQFVTERNMMFGATIGLASCLVAFSLCSNFTHLLILSVPFALFSTTLYTTVGATLSNAVNALENGTASSLGHSLRSAAGVIAPLLGSQILVRAGTEGIAYATGGIMAVAALLITVLGTTHQQKTD
eukprot:m.38254 g.38254  ORF g.38254 m.38254 type:complete len:428 (+) comp10182_c0_seq1:126-1409(+)